LTRREWLFSAAGAGFTALSAPHLFAQSTAEALYGTRIVTDGLGFPGGLSRDESTRLNEKEVADIQASGLTATHLTVGPVGTMTPLAAFEQIVRDIARWENDIDAHPEVLSRVRLPSDIQAAKDAGITGLIYGLQDGVSFEDDPQASRNGHRRALRNRDRLPVRRRSQHTEAF